MKKETYYRMLQDLHFPCPKCGKDLEVLEKEVTRTMFCDGRYKPYCKHCGTYIPFLDKREYDGKPNRTLKGLP